MQAWVLGRNLETSAYRFILNISFCRVNYQNFPIGALSDFSGTNGVLSKSISPTQVELESIEMQQLKGVRTIA
jgi:hypothetical protein